jgi:C4-type Zn-finger protein
MSEEKLKKYAYNTCPKCGGFDQYRPPQTADINNESQTVAVQVECENCGYEYSEIYRFVEFYLPENKG